MTPADCGNCGHPLAAQHRRLPEGHRPHYGHGLCGSCYTTDRRRGTLPVGHCKAGRARADDVDEVVVLRLLDGTLTGTPTTAELALAIAQLDRYRLSAREIAARIGCTARTVQRHRAQQRKEAA